MDQEVIAGGLNSSSLSGRPICSGADYADSLRGRNLNVYAPISSKSTAATSE